MSRAGQEHQHGLVAGPSKIDALRSPPVFPTEVEEEAMRGSWMTTAVPVLAAVQLACAAAPAAAARPDVQRFHTKSNYVVVDSLICGISAVESTHDRRYLVLGGSETGNSTTATGLLRSTFTAASGRSVTWTSAARSSFTEVINSDGTSTLVERHDGALLKLVGEDGRPLLFDRGVLVVVTATVDVGDPDDPSDDEVLRTTVTAGPHPYAEDPQSFCAAVARALT